MGLTLTASVGLGLAFAGAASTPTPTDDPAGAELREHHRHHHHGGVMAFIAMGLDTLGTDVTKRPQVEQLQNDLRAQMVPARDAEKGLLLALADGVAAGKIDTRTVDDAITKATAASAAAHEASLEALNQLHALLSPAERAALVGKVQAHWAVWHEANPDNASGGHAHGDRLAALTKHLGLTPDQVSKISAALDSSKAGSGKFDANEVEQRVQAFSTAFESNSFDAMSLGAPVAGPMSSHGATRMAAFYEAVAPVLTPDQRAKLAEHLRQHANYVPVSGTQGK
jgi:Spy/CpxP family protein refolding chaperone